METTVVHEPLVERPWYLENLTPFPPAALYLLRTLSTPEVSIREVTDAVKMDTVFAANLLQAANSPMFGHTYSIETVERAATALGLDYVTKVALSVVLRNYLKPTASASSTRRCWRHSLACALLAEELAPYYSMPRNPSYTAGLLHDIGRLALAAAFPKGYARMLDLCEREGLDILACERQLLGTDHATAGLWIAVEWKLPSETFRAIWDHHDTPDEEERSLTAVVHAACRIADVIGYGVANTARPADEVLESLPAGVQAYVRPNLEFIKERVSLKVDSF